MTLTDQLGHYKNQIDADITAYASHARSAALEQYGAYGELITDAFLDMLERGGKRLRGALVMTGYRMCGGTDETMIVRAATVAEMMHAYLLIIDDIQDRSLTRRGKPTVHMMLANYHKKHNLPGETSHAGLSLALNAILAGGHATQMLLAGLHVDPELKVKALGILNQAAVVTAHGQTLDIMQELTGQATETSIEQTMEWKTAYYSVLNPLCVGMVLAGAGCDDTDAIRDYAIHTGKAFQITDDIIGIFGNEAQTGKNPMDDVREGKQTLLTLYGLAHASAEKVAYLRACLGNEKLSDSDFKQCQDILKQTGALRYAEERTHFHIEKALQSLGRAPKAWRHNEVAFLHELAESIEHRTT